MPAAEASKAKSLATNKALCYSGFRTENSMYRLTIKKQALRPFRRCLGRMPCVFVGHWTDWPKTPTGEMLILLLWRGDRLFVCALADFGSFLRETIERARLMYCASHHVVRLTGSRRTGLMSNLQIIHDDTGQPMFAVIPWREYVRLSRDGTSEANLRNEEIYDLAKDEGGESFPIEVVDRLLSGVSPIKVYREYRGMSQKALAATIGISRFTSPRSRRVGAWALPGHWLRSHRHLKSA